MNKHRHGSDAVMSGKLRGATDDTDYFYFFCPNCPNDRLLRVLDYRMIREEKGNTYSEKVKTKAIRSFVLAFDVTCEECGFRDCVKLSNIGWQGGTHADTLKSTAQLG
jgi:predicted RNA-binding Zn-ribbon protein involved in translation (DUF1610 family)